jgi:hypothetical protein
MLDSGFWRALLNDPHYFIPAGVIVAALIYMAGRFVVVEKTQPSLVTETPSLMKQPDSVPPPDNRKGNFNEGQKGGTTHQTYIENLNVNADLLLTEAGKAHVLSEVQRIAGPASKKPCINVGFVQGTKHAKLFQQLMELLTANGYTYRTQAFMYHRTGPPIEWDINDPDCLSFIVGTFS